MSEEAIALALGISRPTLRQHFMAELTVGAAQKRMDVLEALFGQVKKGNVAAIKTALLLSDAAGVGKQPEQQDGDGNAPAAAPPARAPRLGKKEAANLAAKSAADGTEWDGLLPGSNSVQ